MHKTERLMLENFPLEDYQENRKQYGHMQFVRQAFCREIAPGVKYEECLYRRGDGVEVWVYLVHLPKDAPVQLAVAAAPLRMAKPVKRHAQEFEQFFGRTFADSPEIDGRVWIASDEPLVEGDFVTVCIDSLIDGDLSGYIMEEEI